MLFVQKLITALIKTAIITVVYSYIIIIIYNKKSIN